MLGLVPGEGELLCEHQIISKGRLAQAMISVVAGDKWDAADRAWAEMLRRKVSRQVEPCIKELPEKVNEKQEE